MDNKALNCVSSSLRHLCSFWNQNKFCWKSLLGEAKAAELSPALLGKRGVGEGLSGCARPPLLIKETYFRELQVFQAPNLCEGSAVSLREGLHCQPFTGIPGAPTLGFEKRKWLKLQAVGWGSELVFAWWIAGILEVWALFEELLMPHGKLKKHFLSETILCSIKHFLLSSVCFH